MAGLTAIFVLVVKRVGNNVRLYLATFVGLFLVVSLVSAVPLYSQGTLERLLHQQLRTIKDRPPGAIWVRNVQEIGYPSVNAQYLEFDRYFRENVAQIVNLPIRRFVSYITTHTYVLWPAEERGEISRLDLRHGFLASTSDLSQHIRIIEGEGLDSSAVAEGEDIPAIVTMKTAEGLYLNVGDRYLFVDDVRYNPSGLPIRIVGIWEPVEPDSDYWLYDPRLYFRTLFISEENMLTHVLAKLPESADEFSFYAISDEANIHAYNAARITTGLRYLETRAQIVFPHSRLSTKLPEVLAEYERRAHVLNIVLFALSAPMAAVALYYISVAMGMVVERQRGEIALLKSRGASTFQLIGISLVEGLVLGGVALAAGPLAGAGIAKLIANAYGFLLFARRPPIHIAITPEAMRYAGVAVALAIAATLIPAIVAARHSIVSHKQEAARPNRQPLFQRLFFDVALLGLVAYGYFMLQQQKTILTLGRDMQYLVDPLLLVAPTLFIVALALMFLRAFPLATAILGYCASWIGNPSLLLALRQIARQPVQYTALVLLLTLTLALGSYTASAAHTIDRNLADQVRYEIPADLELMESWGSDEQEQIVSAPPFSVHDVAGVAGASPFKVYRVGVGIGPRPIDAQLLAIDRLTYPQVAWWRSDFSSKPLGGLMNALGANEAALIVHPSFMTQYQLNYGDPVNLLFDRVPVPFYIAESVDYFPPMYPEEGFFFIANLDYVYEMVGIQPYRVWLNLADGAEPLEVIDRIAVNGVAVLDIRDSRLKIVGGRTDPHRTGLFGVLSIGFLVAALLTVLSFFLHSFLTFERRLVQFGILRAMGLSVRQLFALLVFEQLYLIAVSVAFGTVLGILTGKLFIPFLQESVTATGVTTPKFVVETAWGEIQRIYGVLGAMVVLSLLSTVWLIRRMQLYRTVKLGEEQ